MSHKIDCLECFIQGELQGEKTGSLVETERILKLLEKDFFHDIQGQVITLQAGMEPQQIIRHASNCLGCTAVALIKGEK